MWPRFGAPMYGLALKLGSMAAIMSALRAGSGLPPWQLWQPRPIRAWTSMGNFFTFSRAFASNISGLPWQFVHDVGGVAAKAFAAKRIAIAAMRSADVSSARGRADEDV